MKELVQEIKNSGIESATSFLNSGNLIVDSELSPELIMFHVDQSIKQFKSDGTRLWSKSAEDLSRIVQQNPFTDRENLDKSKLLVYFLSEPVVDFSPIRSNPKVTESFVGIEDTLFVYYDHGIGTSFLTTNYIDKVLGIASTGRNMNTIEKLLTQ